MIGMLTMAHLQVPEDLALILNDSSLFSSSADITTKEILKRYGDRAKAPVVSSPSVNAAKTDSYGDVQSPVAPGLVERSAPPVNTFANRTQVDEAAAWGNESSVRHVPGGSDTPPQQQQGQYGGGSGRRSEESPSRGSAMRRAEWDRQRAMGMA